LPEGDYTITATAQAAQAGSETIDLDLVHHRLNGDEQVLASGELSLQLGPPSFSATTALTLHGAPIAADCGDALIVRSRHPSGTQTLFPFQLALDIP
jgi:hypothetical protein